MDECGEQRRHGGEPVESTPEERAARTAARQLRIRIPGGVPALMQDARTRWAGRTYQEIQAIIEETLSRLLEPEGMTASAAIAVAMLCKVQMFCIEEVRQEEEREKFQARVAHRIGMGRVG